jgi:hypothetical protein
VQGFASAVIVVRLPWGCRSSGLHVCTEVRNHVSVVSTHHCAVKIEKMWLFGSKPVVKCDVNCAILFCDYSWPRSIQKAKVQQVVHMSHPATLTTQTKCMRSTSTYPGNVAGSFSAREYPQIVVDIISPVVFLIPKYWSLSLMYMSM